MLTFKIPSGVHPVDQKKKRRYLNAIKKATYGTRTHTLNCEEKKGIDKNSFVKNAPNVYYNNNYNNSFIKLSFINSALN